MNNEIGGYIEFERYNGKLMHNNAVALNCGRNCLAYLIEAKHIKKILLPYYLCDSIKNICITKGIQIKYYNIDTDFNPLVDSVDDDEWIYIVNYYGQISNKKLSFFYQKHARVIVDNSHAYYQPPIHGVDTIYNCRKFFGVADGAFLYTDTKLLRTLPVDESFARMHFLMGRFERTASEFYSDYVSNNKIFASEELKIMSKLTKNILRSINYTEVNKIRTDNFSYLHKAFADINLLKVNDIKGAYAYPLCLETSEEIKAKLISKKIYIPTIWPNVLNDVNKNDIEYKYVQKILPIPCDQRYGESEMRKIIEAVHKCLR